MIIYKINTSSEIDIFNHLILCDKDFIPPLSERVNVLSYSRKIRSTAVLFEAWEDEKLVGLVAGYFNKKEEGYITNVSVIKEKQKDGIGSKLLDMCINYGNSNRIKILLLEVYEKNPSIVKWYRKNGFLEYQKIGDNLKMYLSLNK